MRGRIALIIPVGLLLSMAAGCASRQAAFPEHLEFVCFVGAPGGPGPARPGLAPSRDRNAELPGPGGLVLVAGDFDIYADIPLCDVDTEGYFVAFPARLGATCLALPFFILAIPFMLSENETVGRCAFAPTWAMLYVGAVVLGGPFWVVREVLWDGPRAFGRWAALHTRGPKGQVDFLASRSRHPRNGLEICARLRTLTGEKADPPDGWEEWWRLHREDFGANMERVRPSAEGTPPERPAKPVPAPVPAT